MSQIIELKTLADLNLLALSLIPELKPRQIVLLSGPVGSGKTQFVRFLLVALGSSEVSSPSFAIHHSYSTARGSVEHIDLYRLQSADDLESTGFWDLFAEAQGLVFIEWADRLDEDQLPLTWPKIKLQMKITGANSRQIEISRF